MVSFSNISELYLVIGNIKQALRYAKQSVKLADSSDDAFSRIAFRGLLADVLHQAGRSSEADGIFHEAENLQQQTQPDIPFLYFALAGVRYCDLLLDQGMYQEVQDRARRSLDLTKGEGFLLDDALDNLCLGRSHFLQSQREFNHALTKPTNHINRAVDGLRQAGHQEYIPLGLLARAEFSCATGELIRAQRDLDEAFSIATRGGMGLHLADCHLEYARFYLAKGETAKAREHWQIAKDSIEKMGYHRRDKEVQELEEQLQ